MKTMFEAELGIQARQTIPVSDAPAPSLPPRPAFVAESPPTRFARAKLGVQLLLGADVLLVAGAFVFYAVLRLSHPEVFRFGSRVLDPWYGAVNEIVLALSAFSMAWAVHCVRAGQRLRLILALLLTVTGGATFMGVRAIESSRPLQEGFNWRLGFRSLPEPERPALTAPKRAAAPVAAAPVRADPLRGRELWMGTCRACHGLAGEGLPGQGKDLRGSQFIAGESDKDLLAFVKVGRMPFDKLNTTGIQMPPRGGNPLLKDQDLIHIISYVRTFKVPNVSATGEPAVAAAKEELYIPKSVIPPAPPGPAGLAANWDRVRAEKDRQAALASIRPVNAHLFFNLYALMTGVHGLNVLAGLLLLTVITVRVMCKPVAGLQPAPIERVRLLWHAVVVIWFALFPLLYLAW